jgi:hypothetical protein
LPVPAASLKQRIEMKGTESSFKKLSYTQVPVSNPHSKETTCFHPSRKLKAFLLKSREMFFGEEKSEYLYTRRHRVQSRTERCRWKTGG